MRLNARTMCRQARVSKRSGDVARRPGTHVMRRLRKLTKRSRTRKGTVKVSRGSKYLFPARLGLWDEGIDVARNGDTARKMRAPR